MNFLKEQIFGKRDLISLGQVNELIKGLNKKHEVQESKKKNTWIIIGLIVLGVVVAGVVAYKLFFASDDYDEYDEFDDDFEDIEFDEYEDFDDFEDDYDEEFSDEIDEMIDGVSDDNE